MTQQEASAAPNVITGKIYLHDMEVYVLIDPGSTHSFISSATVSHLHQSLGVLGKDLVVSTPVGEQVKVQTVFRNYIIRINMIELPANLIVFPLIELDVILGMD